MKSIKLEVNKETIIINGDKKEIELDEKKIVIGILKTPFKQGAKPSEIEQRLALVDKLERASDILELEDSEYAIIGFLISNFNFSIISKHIVNLNKKFNET